VVLCETRDLQDNPLLDNSRAKLRQMLPPEGEPWWGFKQNYIVQSFTSINQPFQDVNLWSGAADQHFLTCLDAGVLIHGADWKKDHGWFSIGPRGIPNEVEEQQPTALIACDHLWIARFFLDRILLSQGICLQDTTLTVYLSSARTREKRTNQEAEELRERLLKAQLVWVSKIAVCASVQPKGFSHLSILVSPKLHDPYHVVTWLLKALQENQ